MINKDSKNSKHFKIASYEKLSNLKVRCERNSLKLCTDNANLVIFNPVCLLGNEFENMEAIIAGWGVTSEEGDRTNVLMEAKVLTIITRRLCLCCNNQSFLKNYNSGFRNIFCIQCI